MMACVSVLAIAANSEPEPIISDGLCANGDGDCSAVHGSSMIARQHRRDEIVQEVLLCANEHIQALIDNLECTSDPQNQNVVNVITTPTEITEHQCNAQAYAFSNVKESTLNFLKQNCETNPASLMEAGANTSKAKWGFLKNIVNINRFFDSGVKALLETRANSKSQSNEGEAFFCTNDALDEFFGESSLVQTNGEAKWGFLKNIVNIDRFFASGVKALLQAHTTNGESWGFLKNIVNIDRFFDSGHKAPSTGGDLLETGVNRKRMQVSVLCNLDESNIQELKQRCSTSE